MEGVCLYFQSVLQQSDAVTDALREENEVLKNQIQDLTEQVQSKGEADDVIMVAVNQKVDEWQVSFFQVSLSIMGGVGGCGVRMPCSCFMWPTLDS